jgi:hypothetical protein
LEVLEMNSLAGTITFGVIFNFDIIELNPFELDRCWEGRRGI